MQIYIRLIALVIFINTQNKHSNKYKITPVYTTFHLPLLPSRKTRQHPRGPTRCLASALRGLLPGPLPRCREDGITNIVRMHMHAAGITNTHDQIWQDEYIYIYAACICTCVCMSLYIKLKQPPKLSGRGREREKREHIFFPYVFLIPNSSFSSPSLPHFATPSIHLTSFSAHFCHTSPLPFFLLPPPAPFPSIPIRCVAPVPFPPLVFRNEIPVLQLTGHRILHMYYVKRDPPQGIMLNWKSHLVGSPLPSRHILASRSGTSRKEILMTSCWLRTFVEYFPSLGICKHDI